MINRIIYMHVFKKISIKMYTQFEIGLNKEYGLYAQFGYLTLISDTRPNIVV